MTYKPLTGEWAIRFIENLTLTGEYSEQPFKLRDWQKTIVREVFKRKPDRVSNQYKRVFLFFPRSHGKTELAAAIVLARLIGDPRKGQNIFSCGKNQKQAAILFERIAQMIREDPVLSKLCEVSDFKKRVDIKSRYSFYQALTVDTSGGAIHGLNPSTVIFDELHAQGRRREYFSAIETALGKRKDQQLIILSTAGEIASVCEEEFTYARKVSSGEIKDDSYLPVLYYLPNDAECTCGEHEQGWLCPENWHRCNPALSDFKQLEALQQMAKQAKEIPAKELEFRKFHLNQFCHDTTQLIPHDHWLACGKQPVEADDLLGCECFAGLDIGAISDYTALVLIFPQDGNIKVLPFFWLPEERIQERQTRDKVPVLQWCNDGLINVTSGDVTDFEQVRADINAIADKYKIQNIGTDPHNATQLATQLSQDGLPVEWFRQGFISMNAPVQELVRLVISHRLHHGNNPVLNWMATNAMAVYDSNQNIKVDRRNRDQKVDGIVSLAMAIGVAGLCHDCKSVYEERGILTL